MDNNELKQSNTLPKDPLSYWMASTPETSLPKLDGDICVDAAIIGGGMVGITTAYLLKKEGLKVAVIEADRILMGTTGHTTAKISSQHGLIYDKISRSMGKEKAQLYADANENAIRFIENLVREENIQCDFLKRYSCVYTQSDQYIENIENEVKAASCLGIKAYYDESLPLPFDIKCAVRFEDQAQFHPRKYLLHLASKIPGDGSFIFEGTRATGVEEGDKITVTTENKNKITCKQLIIASHFPFYDGLGFYFARLYPHRSYALGVRLKEKFPEGMFLSAEEPSRSLRSQPYEDGELIILSGEHHKTGHSHDTFKHYENLRTFAEDNYQVIDIPYRWSTQDYNTPDGVPYVGHLTNAHPNIYVATGFGKWGMTNSTVSSIIIRDLIIKGENPWTDVYNPSRFKSTVTSQSFYKQNADVAKTLVKGKLENLPEDITVKCGEAQIIKVEGQRLGVYRDEKSKLHIIDTTCTHMGCELEWNSGEKTWDCPCHGSRFTYTGDIVEGPAHYNLNYYCDEKNTDEKNKIGPNII
jgi:glycine/D-amino acid oxidase-like deaminating enzyme/nitrite reductase/ring-hydroxylating ferredoxin subunit